MTFQEFDLAPEFDPVLQSLGFEEPTPVQAEAMPIGLRGEDVIACAQTGSGKTAAFMLPVLTLVADFLDTREKAPRGPLVLVLVPTRELAVQVVEMAAPFAREVDVSITAIYGGVAMQPQIQALHRGVDVIVATPGRLLDHTSSGRIHWGDLRHLILDEGDRMLDIGFLPDIRRIVQHLPTKRQTLLFSATMAGQVRTLADSITHEPKRVTIGDAGRDRVKMPENITHGVYLVSPRRKLELLLKLLDDDGADTVLVFARTKHGTDLLHRTLERKGIKALCIHGDMAQQARQRALDSYREGDFQVLVATDVASRGLDVEGISHVINFDLPQSGDDYVHRAGRTGRVDATGDALSLVTPEEFDQLRNIECAIQMEIPRLERAGLTYAPPKANGRGIGRARRRAAPTRW